MANKLTRLVTASSTFAGIYIFCFIGVIIASVATKGDPVWVKTGWIMLALLGLFVTLAGIASFKVAVASPRWPKTTARVVKSWISQYRTHSKSNRVVYSPMLEYEYEVAGQSYIGDCIDFSSYSGSQRQAQQILDDIGANRDYIQVYYSPNNPETSVILPGLRFVHFLRFFVGIAMMLIGTSAAIGATHLLSRLQ